jgi:hypothetical protein
MSPARMTPPTGPAASMLQHHSLVQPSQTPTLPSELWLQIFEHALATSNEAAEHLWVHARRVSVSFKNLIERIFDSICLRRFAISLALPRRDPTTGRSLWPGAVPGVQVNMSIVSVDTERSTATFASPLVLTDGSDEKSVEELKMAGVLPKERLRAAPAWVCANQNPLAGLTTRLPRNIEWDEQKKVWTWELQWRKLVTQFYEAKRQRRMEKPVHTGSRKSTTGVSTDFAGVLRRSGIAWRNIH